MTESPGWIENGAHVVALRIHWEDTDAAGMVYYANYLRFTERARSNMLRSAGIGQTLSDAEVQAIINYIKALK